MKRIPLGLSVIFLGLTASNASAATSILPGAQWYSDARAVQSSTVNDQPSYVPGANTSTVSDATGTSTVTVTSAPAPSPYVSVQASSSTPLTSTCNPCGGYAEGTGQLLYYVEVVGPGSGNLIPINVSAYGYASSTGTPTFGSEANANLSLSFYGYGASSPQSFQAVSNFGAPTSYINVNNTYQAVVGQQILVEMQANAQAGSSVGIYATSQAPYNAASAYVDPYFSLPQWAVDQGYQLDFSAGLGNSPVSAPGPTPGTGLAGLAFLMLAGLMTKARGFLAR